MVTIHKNNFSLQTDVMYIKVCITQAIIHLWNTFVCVNCLEYKGIFNQNKARSPSALVVITHVIGFASDLGNN